MPTNSRLGRDGNSFSKPVIVGALLIAAALMLGVAHIKRASVERAYRHTRYAAADVVSVGSNGVADVRYNLDGKSRTGQLDVSGAQGVDRGDRLAVRVSDVGNKLQLDVPFYAAVYVWTAVGLTVIAATIVVASWRSTGSVRRQRKLWLPGELARTHRKHPAG